MAGDVQQLISKHSGLLHAFEAFFSQYRLKSVEKGQIIIYAGDNPRGVIYLTNGQLRQYDLTFKGNSIVVGIYRAPDILPLSWVINKTPNTYFYEAATNVLYREAPAADFIDFLESEPAATFALLKRSCERSEATLSRMVHTLGSTAHTRLIFDLVTMCHQVGTIRRDGSYLIITNEKDIADRIGLTRETISREVRKLKEEKLVSIERQKVIVWNIRALEERLIRDYETS